ncbi:unnamed protein product [Lampetra planeri]
MCPSGTKEQKLDRRRRRKNRKEGHPLNADSSSLESLCLNQSISPGVQRTAVTTDWTVVLVSPLMANGCDVKALFYWDCTVGEDPTRDDDCLHFLPSGSFGAQPPSRCVWHTRTPDNTIKPQVEHHPPAHTQDLHRNHHGAQNPRFLRHLGDESSENFEELLKALGVNVMLRKIAVKAASKPLVEITQDGETLSIKTSTTVRTTHITFTVGQEFNESTVDGRPCTSFPRWETDSKISCEQTLQKGEGPKTSWTREITNDGKLILTMGADDVICTRVYERQ